MLHAFVGMPETRGKPPSMPTQAWDMAPLYLFDQQKPFNAETPFTVAMESTAHAS
jgi:hypothetical protein